MNKVRDWTVLFIGGPSGAGKSSIAYGLAQFCNVNVVEADDVCQAIKAMTAIDAHPFLHYWNTGKNWLDVGIDDNVNWLIGVSQEMTTGLRAIAARHIEDDVPIIIEGDFIHPELPASFHDPRVKALYIIEPDKNQLLQNFYITS